jgi:hypothetical protein
VNPLVRLESLLREAFEYPIWALRGARLHPAQLGARLEETMREGRVGLAGGTFVPERYVVLLNPDDLNQFGALQSDVERGLTEHLEALLAAEGYRRRGPIAVSLRPDPGVRGGEVEVDAAFVEERARPPLAFERSAHTEAEPPPGATIAIERKAILAAIGRHDEPSTTALAVLTALGEDGREGARHGIEALPCLVGRAPDCDIVLTDLRVSRRHARIDRAADALVIEDLHSANGVQVNGATTERAPLADGDTITLGGPRFRIHLRHPAAGDAPHG